jgi:hypothetical protein
VRRQVPCLMRRLSVTRSPDFFGGDRFSSGRRMFHPDSWGRDLLTRSVGVRLGGRALLVVSDVVCFGAAVTTSTYPLENSGYCRHTGDLYRQ